MLVVVGKILSSWLISNLGEASWVPARERQTSKWILKLWWNSARLLHSQNFWTTAWLKKPPPNLSRSTLGKLLFLHKDFNQVATLVQETKKNRQWNRINILFCFDWEMILGWYHLQPKPGPNRNKEKSKHMFVWVFTQYSGFREY